MSINATRTDALSDTEKAEKAKADTEKAEKAKAEKAKAEKAKAEKAKAEKEKAEKEKAEKEKAEKEKAEKEKAPTVYKQVSDILATATPADVVSVCAAAIAEHMRRIDVTVSGATIRALNPLSGGADYGLVIESWEAAKAEDQREAVSHMNKDDARIARSLISASRACDQATRLDINAALTLIRALEISAREDDALTVRSAAAIRALASVGARR